MGSVLVSSHLDSLPRGEVAIDIRHFVGKFGPERAESFFLVWFRLIGLREFVYLELKIVDWLFELESRCGLVHDAPRRPVGDLSEVCGWN